MEGEKEKELTTARKGLIRAIWSTSVAPRFSSKPIMEDYLVDRNNVFGSSTYHYSNSSVVGESIDMGDDSTAAVERFRNSMKESSNLTKSEHEYLEQLLLSEDLDSIRRASTRLADKEIFPTVEADDHYDPQSPCAEIPSNESTTEIKERKILKRRDSQVQQQLFQLHEKATIMPSAMLKRISGIAAAKASRPLMITHTNSLTLDNDPADVSIDTEMREEKSSKERQSVEEPSAKWNPLKDLNSWIDGSVGIEVDDDGTPEISSPTSNPFKILGTSANDTSCHPHVLSPPLMEGLQLFMPESLQEHHYWLKYSLVRDGPGLLKMLRHCRASQYTVLAIETTDGHVFGSFTSQPWRLISSKGYYGSKESFVWRMRRPRTEAVESVMEQILMESQIDVFPLTSRNNMVQLCTKDCIALGHGELHDVTIGTDKQKDDEAIESNVSVNTPDFYGLAIQLEPSFNRGTTSSSETFGNPCLVQRESIGEAFEIANVELWCMTPHETVEAAEKAEMKALFLEEKRHAGGNLNLIEILVGGTCI